MVAAISQRVVIVASSRMIGRHCQALFATSVPCASKAPFRRFKRIWEPGIVQFTLAARHAGAKSLMLRAFATQLQATAFGMWRASSVIALAEIRGAENRQRQQGAGEKNRPRANPDEPDKEIDMRKYTLLKTVLLASGMTLVSSVFAQSAGSSSPKTAAESPDAAFVQQAGNGGLAEVELSKLAVASAQSPKVKKFARQMVQAHSANNQQLAMIAAHENIALPKELDGEHAQLRDQLAALHGADFDRSYVDAMRGDHQKMEELLKSSQGTVSAEELRTFIKKTLPVVQAHLRMANELKME